LTPQERVTSEGIIILYVTGEMCRTQLCVALVRGSVQWNPFG
jgi:hypothetical protein